MRRKTLAKLAGPLTLPFTWVRFDGMKEPLPSTSEAARYETVFGEVGEIVEGARRSAARSVNAVMTATCWLIERHIAELEQGGRSRAEHGKETVEWLAADLSPRSIEIGDGNHGSRSGCPLPIRRCGRAPRTRSLWYLLRLPIAP